MKKPIKLSTDEMLDVIVGRLDGLHTDLKELKTDVFTLKEDVAQLKTDVSTLKEDVAQLKTDVSTLKEDMHYVKNNLSDVIDTTAEILTNMVTQEEHNQLKKQVSLLQNS